MAALDFLEISESEETLENSTDPSIITSSCIESNFWE